MPIDGHPPLCGPCEERPTPHHEDCEGDRVWCECVTELLIEAEEKP